MDLARLPSPAYVCDLSLLQRNLAVLDDVQARTGAKILLALKGFATWPLFPHVRDHLAGVCASSVHEARLGAEEFGKQVHAFAPAYKEGDIELYQQYADHISFNSIAQWNRYRDRLQNTISCGLRVNPEHSEVEVKLYDPCAPGSRLGIRLDDLAGQNLDGIEGLHFHTLCEKNVDALERTLLVFEEKFAEYIPKMKWINFGGGHHITRVDYDVDRLCEVLTSFQSRYPVQVYLEPGEAIALNTGILVAEVLDIVHNEVDIAILDVSVTCHMPDVLEMPYRPEIEGAGQPDEFTHTYRLGGLSCLAGDVIGDYSFPQPLKIGQRLAFQDMIHYTMVKTTMFNGVRHPAICSYDPQTDRYEVMREFGYEDFKSRLG